MIEDLKKRELIKKAGGHFRLTALIQKRLAELSMGARPLIEDTEGLTRIEIVIKEIMQDKICGEMPEKQAPEQTQEKS